MYDIPFCEKPVSSSLSIIAGILMKAVVIIETFHILSKVVDSTIIGKKMLCSIENMKCKAFGC